MQTNFNISDSLYLCIDQGGHASRAIVFNHKGEVEATARHPVQAQRPGPQQVEYDAEALLESITASIHDVLDQLGEKRHKIVAAGLATQRSNIACWDRETGEALAPILSWQDRRAHKWLQQFHSHADRIHHTTGLFMTAHCGASKLRWCLDHIPAVQAAQQQGRLCLGPMASFIIHRLLKEKPLLTDPVNASRTQLWDLQTMDWDTQLTSLFGVPTSLLPHCVPNEYNYGHLEIKDCRIPLQLVTGDQSAAMYAYGRLQPNTAYINMGTGAFVSRPSGQARLFSQSLLTSLILHKNETKEYVLEGTVNGAASALEWFAQEADIADIFKALPEWLTRFDTDWESAPLFLNGIGGLGAPYWIADFQSRFIGEGDAPQKAVAVAESIIFLLNTNLKEMHKLSSPPEQIQITGGLAQLDGLCQRLADLSGLAVYRPLECEATARGTAHLLAGLPPHWPEVQPGVWFEPKENPALKQRYSDWLSHMQNATGQAQSETAYTPTQGAA